MRERSVDNPFEKQTIVLQPTWDAYLKNFDLYTQDQLDYDALHDSLEDHRAQLRELTQVFLGAQDIYNAPVLAAFCITHINYCWRGLADQTAQARFAFNANPKRFAQKTIDTMEELVTAAQTEEDIDVIENVFEYIAGEIDLAVDETLDAFHSQNTFTAPAIDLTGLQHWVSYLRISDT